MHLRSPYRRGPSSAAAFALLVASAFAQVPVPTWLQPTQYVPAAPFNLPNAFVSTPSDVVVGDFDADGVTDMLVARAAGPGNLYFVRGNTSGSFPAAPTFGPSSTIAAPIGGVVPRGLAVGDFNGDLIQDVVVNYQNPNPTTPASIAQVFFGGATFGQAGTPTTTAINVAATGPTSTRGVAVLDVDLDGDLDIVLAAVDTSQVTACIWYAANNGTGVFTVTGGATGGPLPTGAIIIASGIASTAGLAISDLEGDGDLDVCVGLNANGSPSAVHSVTNVNVAPFFTPTGVSAASSITAASMIMTADLDAQCGVDVVLMGNGVAEGFIACAGPPSAPAALVTGSPMALPANWTGLDAEATDVGNDGLDSFLLPTTAGGFLVMRFFSPLSPSAVEGPFAAGGLATQAAIGLGDFEGDGVVDVGITVAGAFFGQAPVASGLINLTPYGAWWQQASYNTCGSSTLTMTARPTFSQSPVVPGNAFTTLNVVGPPTAQAVAIYGSVGGLTSPYTSSPCSVWIDVPNAVLLNPGGGQTDSAGVYSFTFGSPNPTPASGLVGVQVMMQAVFADSSLTNGVVAAYGF